MTLIALRGELTDSLVRGITPQYADKMLHVVPRGRVVDRVRFLVDAARGQVVLNVGIDGGLHALLGAVATKLYGLDKTLPAYGEYPDLSCILHDLDRCHQVPLPRLADATLVICGEVLEHLSNPGIFLDQLKAGYACPVIVTVPNAFSRAALADGVECVNPDHVAWYSYTTLTTLLTRSGYVVTDFAWYNGSPRTAEGLVMTVR